MQIHAATITSVTKRADGTLRVVTVCGMAIVEEDAMDEALASYNKVFGTHYLENDQLPAHCHFDCFVKEI